MKNPRTTRWFDGDASVGVPPQVENWKDARAVCALLEDELEAATVFRPITPDTPTGYENNLLLWVKGSRPWIDYLGGSDMSDAQCSRKPPTHWLPLPKTPC